ncbi:hypothetical protein B0T16DRAFT_202164 [Cercophora newfieldiana]|uniref:Uncharacterized protein n=1 Tax=Cercophora newfieldiana TaxID=92897 RepID=A0AA39XV20_9PEZI|nr:hypothetical protein B0T16DRAFT_202164 [Cercophora newfieldiana]
MLYSDSQPRVTSLKLGPDEFVEWVNQRSWSRSLERRREEPTAIGELRLIFTNPVAGETTEDSADRDSIRTFPPDKQTHNMTMPFSLGTFRLAQDLLQLPLLTTCFPHSFVRQFQIADGEKTLIGTSTTMIVENTRIEIADKELELLLAFPGWNHYDTGALVSISHFGEAGITNVMLFYLGKDQERFLRDYVTTMAVLASHPVAVPVLLFNVLFERLELVADNLKAILFRLEADSGLSSQMNSVAGRVLTVKESCDDPKLSIEAVTLTQRVVSHLRNLQQLRSLWSVLQNFVVQSLPSSLSEVYDSDSILKLQGSQNNVLANQITNLRSKIEASISRLDEIRGRSELLVAGINNALALRSNEINLSLARSSHRIAQETRKDSSAMKSIAVLTMVFLPATYIATLFATPGIAELTPSQGLYWGVAVPVTGCVLLLWFSWTWLEIRRIDRSNPPVAGAAAEEETTESDGTV